jgi:hypothetical protein
MTSVYIFLNDYMSNNIGLWCPQCGDIVCIQSNETKEISVTCANEKCKHIIDLNIAFADLAETEKDFGKCFYISGGENDPDAYFDRKEFEGKHNKLRPYLIKNSEAPYKLSEYRNTIVYKVSSK